MSRYSKESPAVPISARPIRSLADKNTELPTNSHISKVEGATAEPESSHSNHTVPFISHIPPSNITPKFKFQPISFSDTKMAEGATRDKKVDSPRMDTFLSVRITSPPLISKLAAIQSEINQSHASASRTIIHPSVFHLTLLTMHTGDNEACVRNAVELAQSVIYRHTGALRLNFNGINHFSNKVIFASLLKDDNYHSLSQLAFSFSKIFSERYTESFEDVSEFTPHLTLAKTSKTLSGPYKERMYKFKRQDLVDKIISNNFGCDLGTEDVSSVQLLSMTKPKAKDGFYHSYHTFQL